MCSWQYGKTHCMLAGCHAKYLYVEGGRDGWNEGGMREGREGGNGWRDASFVFEKSTRTSNAQHLNDLNGHHFMQTVWKKLWSLVGPWLVHCFDPLFSLNQGKCTLIFSLDWITLFYIHEILAVAKCLKQVPNSPRELP